MSRTLLLNITKNDKANQVLENLINLFELIFPGRIRGYYLEGSFVDGTSVATSDLDLNIIFKDSFVDEAEREKARQLRDYCAGLSSVELDIDLLEETALYRDGVPPPLKLSSTIVYGEDIRGKLNLLPLSQWTQDRMHTSYWRIVKLFNRCAPIKLPLDYPDRSDEFYGYNQRQITLPNGRKVNCTRDLIRLTSWAATALLAFKAGKYASRKSDSHKLYREYINDEWAGFLEEVYVKCKVDWEYLIPANPQERERLREICRRTLAFENHFLTIYREFILVELEAAQDEPQLETLWVLNQIFFDDAAVKAALQILLQASNKEVQQAAAEVLAKVF